MVNGFVENNAIHFDGAYWHIAFDFGGMVFSFSILAEQFIRPTWT